MIAFKRLRGAVKLRRDGKMRAWTGQSVVMVVCPGVVCYVPCVCVLAVISWESRNSCARQSKRRGEVK